DTEAAGASDDLATIYGGEDGMMICIRAENTARTIVIKHGTGNIECGGADVSLDATDQYAMLLYDATLAKWVMVGGSGAGGVGDVVGPAGVTDNTVALFDGATGKLIKATADNVTTTHALFTNAGAPAFRAIASTDATWAGKQTTAAMDIYVDADDGDDVTGDGTVGTPYETFDRAVEDIPTIINHAVTIHLIAATAAYAAGTLKNRVAGSVDGEIIIEGALAVAVSGDITARADDQNDPVYAANAPVDRLTVTEDLTAADAQQYRLLRVYKAGETDIYRIITGNTDGFVGNSYIYVSHLFGTNPVDDDTWSYSINTWASSMGLLTLANLYVPVTVQNLDMDRVYITGINSSISFIQCLISSADAAHKVNCENATGNIFLTCCYINQGSAANIAFVILGGRVYSLITGCVIYNGVNALNISGGPSYVKTTSGTRLYGVSYTISASVASGAFYSSDGVSVIDDFGAATGILLRQASSFKHYSTTYVYNACATASDAADATVFDALFV
ncbi:MAG: hypothetical protein PHU43_11150, partial [Candidatus Bipolaricaulis sp.]|nr:hypothetical protein [Candidatus Bipolaricaulis sp.]